MKKRIIALAYIIVMIISITTMSVACNSNDFIDVEGTGLTEIALPKGAMVVALLDDSVVFLTSVSGGSADSAAFYRYYLESGRLITIGRSDVVRGRVNCRWVDGVMVIYPPIYSYAEAGANPLSVIDFETNEIRQLASHPSSNQMNVFLTPHRDNVLALKSRAHDMTSNISLYDIYSGDSEVVLEASMDAIGAEYHAIDSYGDMVYAVYSSIPSSDAGKSTTIRVYDSDYEFLQDFSIMDIEHVVDAMAFYITDFRVFGQYIFWRSGSPGSSLIAEIKDSGHLSVIDQRGYIIGGPYLIMQSDGTVAIFGPVRDVSYDFGGKPLNLAFNSDQTTNTQVFFEERSSRVVLLNTEEGTFSEINLPFDDISFEALYMVANGNMVLVCAVPIGGFFGNERYFLYYL